MRISDWSSDVCSSDLVLRRWTPVCAIQDHEPEAGLRIPKGAFATAKLAVGASVDPAPHGVGKPMVAREVHAAIMRTPQTHDADALRRRRQNASQQIGRGTWEGGEWGTVWIMRDKIEKKK